MTSNNPNLDLVNNIAYTKFGGILSLCSHDIERKRNFGVNQGHNLWYKCVKMTGKNRNLDLINITAYTKFG